MVQAIQQNFQFTRVLIQGNVIHTLLTLEFLVRATTNAIRLTSRQRAFHNSLNRHYYGSVLDIRASPTGLCLSPTTARCHRKNECTTETGSEPKKDGIKSSSSQDMECGIKEQTHIFQSICSRFAPYPSVPPASWLTYLLARRYQWRRDTLRAQDV